MRDWSQGGSQTTSTSTSETPSTALTDRRVKAHGFKGGTDIMHEEGIDERQQAVYIIQGRSPVAFIKAKSVFLCHYQVIKNIEINMSRISFDPPDDIKGTILIKEIKLPGQPGYSFSYFFSVDLLRMITERPL